MGFEPQAQPLENKAVNEFMDQMKVVQEEAKAALAKAKNNMAQYYDHGRTSALKYQPRDWVYLDASDITTTHLSKKLSHHQLGPFLVEWQSGLLAYQLWLPAGMQQLHSVFNMVKLTLALKDPILG
ncbi:hypothetical protein C0993_009444 [Termitomyces sp. T159_Od127]|nr:hypothetical protein C0993_009444 [Termitomyces sp. T159_Od127]